MLGEAASTYRIAREKQGRLDLAALPAMVAPAMMMILNFAARHSGA